MEPSIQYAKTEDGVSIAFWTLGEGMPFVHMPSTPYNPTLRMWHTPEGRRWCERLAESRKFVRYDNRGFGHSQRDVTDFSLEAFVRDLEAVVERLAPERVALFGYYQSGPMAIAYAVRHPERVSHLVLWCTSARGGDIYGADTYEALSELAEKDWVFFTESWAQLTFGWSSGEQARQYATYLRESATPKTLRAVFDSTYNVDVTDLLTEVRTPTLVIQRRGIDATGLGVAQSLAARIPDARLVVLEGDLVIPYDDDMAETIATIDDFLGEGTGAESATQGLATDIVHTILFTDVEGSTALTDRLGDAGARDILREHERIVREALKKHGGSEVKTMGDGFMTSFSSATRALECAIAIQSAFAERNESAEEPIKVRIGLNAGEPIAEDDPDGRGDLFGTAVNMAARIASKAEGGEILASNVVRELVAGKEFLFNDRGDTELRGFEDPVRVFEVRWQD